MTTDPLLQSPERSRRHILDTLGNEELLRCGYVPFVAAEIAWDWADTAIEACRICHTAKRECQQVRQLRREYVAERATVFDGYHRDSEQRSADSFAAECRTYFSQLYLGVCNVVMRRWPNLATSDKERVASVYGARCVYWGVLNYAAEQRLKLQDIFGLDNIGHILPPQLARAMAPLRLMAAPYELEREEEAVWQPYGRALSGYLSTCRLNTQGLESITIK